MKNDIAQKLFKPLAILLISAGMLAACGGGESYSANGNDASLLADGEACNPAWVGSAIYVGGNKVSYAGRNYTAAYWTQNNNPSTSSGAAGSGQPWLTGFLCGGTSTTKATTTTTVQVSTTTTKVATTTTAAGSTTTTKAVTTTTVASSCPAYVAGTVYATGKSVSNAGGFYTCTVGGWCSSGASAYEPGVGWAWGSAWSVASATVCPGGSTSSTVTTKATTSTTQATTTSTATTTTTSIVATGIQGMWIWNSRDLLANASQQQTFISLAKSAGITDVFLYLTATDYTASSAGLQSFNTLLNTNRIKVWGLDGCRCYFSDVEGPRALYDNIDALIAFNQRVPVAARFVGFQADQEPQDGQGNYPNNFHNELTDTQLSKTSGGIWTTNQAADREKLMQDFVEFFKVAHGKLAAAGLRTSGAMPSWTEDYYGEPVRVTYNGVRKTVGQHLMAYVDDYIIMSYNTDPANVVGRVKTQVTYASTLPAANRPRVSAALETHAGNGTTVSYGDSPTKHSKRAVLTDIAKIKSSLNSYSAFGGVSIHDLVGWIALPE